MQFGVLTLRNSVNKKCQKIGLMGWKKVFWVPYFLKVTYTKTAPASTSKKLVTIRVSGHAKIAV